MARQDTGYGGTKAIGANTLIKQKRLRWLGYVKRLDDSRTPKTVHFSEARDGSRKRGRPLLRYHDCSELGGVRNATFILESEKM